jgi:hypothetical protein
VFCHTLQLQPVECDCPCQAAPISIHRPSIATSQSVTPNSSTVKPEWEELFLSASVCELPGAACSRNPSSPNCGVNHILPPYDFEVRSTCTETVESDNCPSDLIFRMQLDWNGSCRSFHLAKDQVVATA